MSTEAVRIAKNCSSLCAEHNGGWCPGDTCPYKPTSETPWHDFDYLVIEATAEGRGFRRGARHAQREFRHGFKLGFYSGVICMFGALFVLAIVEWVAR